MDKTLSEDQKLGIIYKFENTKTTLKVIAKEFNISIKDLYSFIENYYNKKGEIPKRMALSTGKKEAKREDDSLRAKKEDLKVLKSILKYATMNGVIPDKINREKKPDIYLFTLLKNLETYYSNENKKNENADFNEDIDIEILSLIEQIKKYPTINQKTDLKTLNKIENWCKARKMSPRSKIKSVKETKVGKKPTEGQYEEQLGKALNYLKSKYLNKVGMVDLTNHINMNITERLIYLDCLPTIDQIKILNKIHKLEKFCEKNKYLPRENIKGVSINKKSRNDENDLTKEQKELKQGHILGNLMRKYLSNQKQSYGKNEFKPENQTDKNIIDRLNKIINSYPTYDQFKTICLLNKIENWCTFNNARPREKIKGVTLPKSKKISLKDLSAEQLEMFFAKKYRAIREKYFAKYGTLEPSDVSNNSEIEILGKIDNIHHFYKFNNQIKGKHLVRKKEILETQLRELSKTRNASSDQIKKIAEYYGIDLDDKKNNNTPYDSDENNGHNYPDER